MSAVSISLTALPGIPFVKPGQDLAALTAAALQSAGIVPRDFDILVLAQKIVSKAEDRYVVLDSVEPSRDSVALAAELGMDARKVEVVLRESRRVVRKRERLLITESRHGFVMANAGVDQSNVESDDGRERLLLLPEDPDASCAKLKAALDRRFGVSMAVVMNDSFGRPFRNGVAGVAIGAAGLPSLRNLVGEPDLFGRPLRVTEIAFADEVASAASILMGQAAEGRPVVHVRGLTWTERDRPAADLVRNRERDLFR